METGGVHHPRSLQAGVLREVLDSEWLPDENDVAWEHLALLGRKELAAFSDNIAVFLNSRGPLLETLYKQITAMVRLLSWPWALLETPWRDGANVSSVQLRIRRVSGSSGGL